MADEPSLPPLPAVSLDPHENQTLRSFRKRVRGDSGFPIVSTSSDPAIFSSDDDPALDNYMQGRRKKKRYVGTWFSQQLASADSGFGDESQPLAKPQKRQLKRQLDSGVWLGSDASNDTDIILEPPSTRRPEIFSTKKPIMSACEEVAHLKIQQCLEDGQEIVDISGYGLDRLPNDLVEPLTRFALIPHVTEDVPFEQRDPEIKLYAGKNSIPRVPATMFNIEHLAVLSLRENCLTELPPSICKLTNLQALNVAQNNLQYLPGELLELLRPGSKLNDLVVHPNPFLQPDSLSYQSWGSSDYELLTFGVSDGKVEGDWSGYSTSLRGRSPVQYTDSTGLLCSGFKIAPLAPNTNRIPYEDFWVLDKPTARSRPHLAVESDNEPGRVPTLFELALRAATRAPHIEEIVEEIEGEVADHIPPAVKRATYVHETGGQACCICKRQVMIPQTEWLEWREVFRTSTTNRNGFHATRVSQMVRTGDDIWVPFVRRGCSWRCVPKTVQQPPHPS
ncbi:hypothetical protein GQ53DRAFT_546863 [Thozetella sp. PMI_491]|nr:hypothetical protein GQ53DRAFT_546863 [Thozetella sp. PMI_491]